MKKTAVLLLLFCAIGSIAQKSSIYVNPYTKELFISEGGEKPGFLNWEIIPVEGKEASLHEYQEQGFQFTTYPFKEETLFGAVALLTIGLILFGLLRRLKH